MASEANECTVRMDETPSCATSLARASAVCTSLEFFASHLAYLKPNQQKA